MQNEKIYDSKNDEEYMKQALALAREAAQAGEVPVGAVVVWEDEDGGRRVVGTGRNRREGDKSALAHAEIEAIGQACKTLCGWRLHRATLYVTLEPCPMCAGAVVNARIKRVVYGAPDKRFGAMGSLFDLPALPLNHKPQVENGLLCGECAEMMGEFFEKLRNK